MPEKPVPALKFGRLAPYPESVKPRLKLANYLHAPLPPAPAKVDWFSKIAVWPMFLNDTIGDCTVAAAGHMIESSSTYGSSSVLLSDAQILAAYEEITGYQPGNPNTDAGARIQDVLGYWRSFGLGGHKALAFAQVDQANDTEVKQAVDLFGSLDLGINCPQSAIDQFQAGKPWDVVSDDGGIAGGHSIELAGYDGTYFYVVTWGELQPMTPAFWKAYVEEAWLAIIPEWFNAGIDPQGVDLYGLGQDMSALTGDPSPFPAPTPVPTPLPPGPTPTPPPPTVGCAVAALGLLTMVALVRR